MNNDLLKYLNGNVNVANAIVSREKLKSGIEHVYVSIDGVDIYDFWFNTKKKKEHNPKHTGGKKSYAKIYLEKLETYDISIEALGFMVKLLPYIQWSTGYLLKKRSKKKLKTDDILKIVNKSRNTAFKIINEMKKYNLISYDSEGYRVNKEFIMKGGVK